MSGYLNKEIEQVAASDLATLTLSASDKVLNHFLLGGYSYNALITTPMVIAYASATAKHYGGYLDGSFKRILVDIMNNVYQGNAEATVEEALRLWSDVVENTSVCRNLEVCKLNHLLEKYHLI